MTNLDLLFEIDPDNPWNYRCLSIHNNLDWQLVRDFPDKPWDYSHLSRRKDLDLHLVIDFPNKDWCREVIPDIDVNYILSNLEFYTTEQLSGLEFKGEILGLITKSARNIQ